MMRSLLIFVAPLLLGLAQTTVALAAAMPTPEPPSFDATSYLLADFHSGQELAARDPDMRVEPASITKLMTSYIAFSEIQKGNLSLEEEVTISETAWRTGGSRMFVEVGSAVTVENLLRGIIIQSGNDASVALAEHIAGSESAFAEWMNSYARDLGMTGSNFVNATGWPHADHYVTARDIATLAKSLIDNFPEHYALYSEKVFEYNSIKQYNRNKLLWRDDSVDGLKTGHTESAGYCLVSSAERDGMRLISVVLGTGSESARASASQSLLNYGFRFFDTRRLYEAGEPITTVRPWKGAFDALDLGVENDLYVTVPRGRIGDIVVQPDVADQLIAPIQGGTVLGELHIGLDGERIASEPLVALRDVPKGGLWRQLVDEVRLLIAR